MPGNPKDAVVEVELHSDNPIDFTVTSTDLPIDAKGCLIFCNDHHPGFHIHFKFSDMTNAGYLFPPNNDKQEAVWSKLGASCPESPAHDIFTVISVCQDQKTLKVHNRNPEPALGEFHYTLRVTKDGGASYLPLDPGGFNQNGPSLMLFSPVVFVAGGVAGSLLTLGTQALLSS